MQFANESFFLELWSECTGSDADALMDIPFRDCDTVMVESITHRAVGLAEGGLTVDSKSLLGTFFESFFVFY